LKKKKSVGIEMSRSHVIKVWILTPEYS
jgi:hypothetical protein